MVSFHSSSSQETCWWLNYDSVLATTCRKLKIFKFYWRTDAVCSPRLCFRRRTDGIIRTRINTAVTALQRSCNTSLCTVFGSILYRWNDKIRLEECAYKVLQSANSTRTQSIATRQWQNCRGPVCKRSHYLSLRLSFHKFVVSSRLKIRYRKIKLAFS